MTARIFKLPFFLAFVASILFGCQGDEGTIRPAKEAHTYNLKGYVQKGPFINGTMITISELDQELVATGKNFTTQTTDNKGSFSLEGVELQSNFVQLMANGFYFDEVSGEKSVAPLTLFALADTSAVSSVNINPLSHLEKDRVIYLMQNEEKSFANAKKQAQQEVLAIFGIQKDDIVPSEQLDISQGGEDNAILLAVSVILQGYGSVADLSELLANISGDLKPDGILNDSTLGSALIDNAFYLDLTTIRENITSRYQELGDMVAVGNFEKYVQNFVSSTEFVLTQKIEYPAQGFYGENLLHGTKERYLKTYDSKSESFTTYYDIYAQLPVGTELKVKISSPSSNTLTWSFVHGSNEGWIYTDFSKADQSMVFTTTSHGEARLKFILDGDVKIEIYEQGATTPTRVKNIDAY